MTHPDPKPIELPPVWMPGEGRPAAAFVERFRSNASCRVAEPPEDVHVRAKKNTPIYRAHSYHTKVPPQGIEPFIRHFSPAGGLVLDPFCGSGMTGVAALRAGRRALLTDLSPAAAFIAANCCTGVNAKAFLAEAEAIANRAAERLADAFATACPGCGGDASITMTVFSAVYRCPECSCDYALWDVARGGRRVSRSYDCPGCKHELQKTSCELTGSRPVLVKYRCAGCGRGEKPPDDNDIERIRSIEDAGLPDGLWCPDAPIPERSDEIGRVRRSGIHTVADLFTPRNRLALATLWNIITQVEDASLRCRLAFAFTGTLPRASRTNKYIPSLGVAPGPLMGTMYIPGFCPEVNVLELFRRKTSDVARAMDGLPSVGRAGVRVCTQSATDLSDIADNAVDYVFTDPPFGGNIQYSELNLLWESWLGQLTDSTSEAVINRSQDKGSDDYCGLLRQAFAEMHRVLRPKGWLTLLFHNSSGKVWRGMQEALDEAGFDVRFLGSFDKAHNTFKQITADGAVGFDVLLHARRARGRSLWSSAFRSGREAADGPGALDRLEAFLRERLEGAVESPPPARLRKLHSDAIALFMKSGEAVSFSYGDFRKLARRIVQERNE